MAVADSEYNFIMCDVGAHGSNSDGSCIHSTVFFKKLLANQLNLPEEECPTNSSSKLSFVFIGDEAFSLRKDFMKPFNKRQLKYERRVFNYRLSRARRVVENVFGIMVSRFAILQNAIQLKNVENSKIVVLACCYLHNFLRKRETSSYSTINVSSDNRLESRLLDVEPSNFTNAVTEAKEIREKFTHYFVNEGRVDWQDEAILRNF